MVQKCTELITEIQHTFENEELTKNEDGETQRLQHEIIRLRYTKNRNHEVGDIFDRMELDN